MKPRRRLRRAVYAWDCTPGGTLELPHGVKILAANAPKRLTKIQAFICRLQNGRFGLVIWGGPHNGLVTDYSQYSSARFKAALCGASIFHVDI